MNGCRSCRTSRPPARSSTARMTSRRPGIRACLTAPRSSDLIELVAKAVVGDRAVGREQPAGIPPRSTSNPPRAPPSPPPSRPTKTSGETEFAGRREAAATDLSMQHRVDGWLPGTLVGLYDGAAQEDAPGRARRAIRATDRPRGSRRVDRRQLHGTSLTGWSCWPTVAASTAGRAGSQRAPRPLPGDAPIAESESEPLPPTSESPRSSRRDLRPPSRSSVDRSLHPPRANRPGPVGAHGADLGRRR